MIGFIEIAYFLASLSFVIGLKMLSHPDSARKGNLLAAIGMGLAIILTIAGEKIHNLGWIFAALFVGTLLGAVSARKVKMTAMPQMVSLFNGMGGACAAVISLVEFAHHPELQVSLANSTTAIILLGMLIGSVSFSGSMIAFGKLQGYKAIEKPVTFPFQKMFNTILLIITFGIGVHILFNLSNPHQASGLFYTMFALSLLYGILFVLPIGGADMPVVISLLNSFTGVAAACAGFLYSNMVMLIGGILVGSAGTILTVVMCNAMNRSLVSVIFGTFGGGGTAAAGGGASGDQIVREISLTDAAILMSYAKKVVIVPGYGLAVAQAQHTCHELDNLLEEKGVDVKYAIHPVAGRMPGHMNVLLAEADVPYDKLFDMEDINSDFASTDVVLVIGANDVVNPAARKDPASPIYGMPILDVDNAANIIVLKRGMNAGYAGIENELFFDPKTKMLFGDAKSSLLKLVAEVKQN